MAKKTITIGGVEHIDASKEDTIATVVGGVVAVAGIAFLGMGAIWALIETIIF